MHPMGHHVPDSNFKFMNLKFSKTYSKWILNHAQKCQEFNGENRFSIGCFVEEQLIGTQLKFEEREGRDLEGVPAYRCCFYALYLRIQVL
jgi:hypothetical protein